MKPSMDLHISRENSSLRQQVTDRLREAILSGTFEPGQKLIERDLCEMLGISRTVLRESLQYLGAEGLITNIPHKGPVVSTITYEEAEDIYAVRQALEALAGEGFAVHATDDQIQALRESLDTLKDIDAARSTHSILDAKNDFYKILLDGCGNAVAGSMLTLLNNRVTILRRLSLSGKDRLPQTIEELSEIVAAIEGRNPKLAKKLCAGHVAKAAAVALKNLRNSADEAA